MMSDVFDIDHLINEIEQGRTDCFGRIVRQYALPLRGFLAAQIHHQEDIDDLAQDVFLAALEGLSTFRRGSDFGAWLRGIARNKLLLYFRGQSRRCQAMQRFRDQVSQTIQHDLERVADAYPSERIERLLHCISQLPERLRRIVRSGLEGNSATELAKELDTTIGTIYNLHYRANQMLRECMQKEPA